MKYKLLANFETSIILLRILLERRQKTYLRSKVVFWLKAENLHGCYIQVYEDVFEGGSVPWLWGPALFDQQFVPLRAGPWDGELKRIRSDPEDDS